jgi:hypothetical protein
MIASKQHSRLALALLAGLLAGRATAASPRDELLRFVPDDAGFCLVVQNLRAQAADLLASPFVQQWSRSPLAAGLAASAEWKQVVRAEAELRKILGVDWPTLRDDVLGDAFVFAYRPGPAGKPEQDQGLFLLRARSAKVLGNLVARANEAQKACNELKGLVEREHRGVKYVRREETRHPTFYLLRDRVLLFTSQEAFLRQAIEQDLDLAANARPPQARRLGALNLDDALLAVTLNPRAFDEAVAARSAEGPAARTLAGIWKALQGVGLGVHLDRDLRLSLTVKARAEDLPAPARRFLLSGSKASGVWSAFPDNALLAVASRVDVPALYELLGQCLGPAARERLEAGLKHSLGAVLGKDVIREVIPALGPDWGLCLTAPPAEGKTWAPGFLLAVKVAEGEPGDPVDQALLGAVHLGAQLAVLGNNKTHPDRPIRLRASTLEGVKVRYLDGEGTFPPGVRPAFALKAGHLVLASSPDEVARFKPAAVPAGGTVPLLRLSLKDLRRYLKQRRDELAAVVAHKDNVPKEKALERIDGTAAVLHFLDRVELTQKTAPGQLTLTLSVQTAQALRK